TLAGQIVMEGYLDLRIRPWLRRLITRLIAIVPAVVCIVWFGDDSLGRLLVFSQVVLSLQLGFAVIPLIHFNSDRRTMGEHTIPLWARLLAWACAAIIVILNAGLVLEETRGWIAEHGWGIGAIAMLVVLVLALALLLYITLAPFIRRAREAKEHLHEAAPRLELASTKPYTHIAITVDFSDNDRRTIAAALAQGGTRANYLLLHITESAAARYLGAESGDRETFGDEANLKSYVEQLTAQGYTAAARIGHGHAPMAIAGLVNESGCDLLVMGAHGHRGLKDILLGTTVDAVRHRVKVPVFIVQ
ncbi:MAG TPA: divalent metal cation transporter, partial [Flavobacteriales bacterium]